MYGRVLVVFALSLSVTCVAWGQVPSPDPNQPAGQNTKPATSKPASPPSGLSYVQMNTTVAACLKAIASDKKNKLIVRLNAVDSLAGLPALVATSDAANVKTAVVQDLKELLCHALPNSQVDCPAPTNCAQNAAAAAKAKADADAKADAAKTAQADATAKGNAAATADADAKKPDATAETKAGAKTKAAAAAKAKTDADANAAAAAEAKADADAKDAAAVQCPPVGVNPNCDCAPCCDFFCSDSERDVFILHVVTALGSLGPYAAPALSALAKATVVDDAVVKGAIMNAQQAILTAPPQTPSQTPSSSPSGSGGSQASGATIPLTITISVVPQQAAATPPAAPASGVIIPVTIQLTEVPQQAPAKPAAPGAPAPGAGAP